MTGWRFSASVCAMVMALAAQQALAQSASEPADVVQADITGSDLAQSPVAETIPGMEAVDTTAAAYPPALPDALLNAIPGMGLDNDKASTTTASVNAAASSAADTSPAVSAPFDAAPTPTVKAPADARSALASLIAERLPLMATAVARLGEAERQGLIAYYAAREHRPLWVAEGRFTPAAEAVAARLALAVDDGLFARDYVLLPLATGSDAALAEAELRLSALAVLYARDARGGRLEPRRISSLMTPKLTLPAAAEVLDKLSVADDANAALASYNPSHAGYIALRAKLAEIRKGRTAQEPLVLVPAGPALRVGMRDARVPLIRARLKLGPNYAAPGDEAVYDADVAEAVSAFQKTAGLRVTGIVGPSTLDAMRTSPASRLDSDLVAQMERWRWLPLDLGKRHIFVNVPEYTMRLMENGEAIHTARVIVGKADTPTPIFSHVMDQLVVNPSWFLPPSILKNEILPRLAADPDYAAKRGYIVMRRGNSITVRQPPGERNALGNIKFLFPNEHAVYLHDTPGRHLFSATARAFSHGCVRVDQPMKLGELVLGKHEGWSEQRLRAMIGGGERTIRFTNPLPVHLTYMTHVVDGDGKLITFSDIYGFHARVRTALGLGT